MRFGAVGFALAGFAGVCVLGGVAFAEAVSLPERKAGLWELTTTMDEGQGPVDRTLTMCVDAEMERNTVIASLIEHKQACTKYNIAREGDKTVVDMACKFDTRNVEGRTEMSGDFQSALLVKIESTTSGDHRGQSVAVKRTITQTGKYLGESCGELTGGEAMSSDGTRVMVQ
ncbi:hypothetical protein W911_09140 [Hyphomicrobium nitrativorans NL23]|uniref:DUF3617 family protein n=1 Tax=Hyphomicrobium nitrativorans NL23 TaxID=1029756 RepID=V5SI17_9HYPH|nr:DUF3617 family protein [Hyphomicrobium nitrativorans]AHB50142.1 hypothetical protein W911_09140 [Hyphomicrobium nitrativorans NL23]